MKQYFYENKLIIAKQSRMLLIMWLKSRHLWNIKVFYKMIMITTSIKTAFGKEH